MSNPWFRMYSELAFDPKVQVLTEALQRRYVMALCLHCDNKLKNRPDDEIALSLRVTLDEWISTKEILISRGLLTKDLEPCGWQKRQYISDIKDSTAAERQKRYRDKKRNAPVTSRLPEADTDTETDSEKNKKSRFPEIWGAFPEVNRTRGNRKKAEAAYLAALKKTDHETILNGVKAYATYCRNTGQSNADTFRWLQDERWGDDYTVPKPSPTGKPEGKSAQAREAIFTAIKESCG
jgi:hypothetical protein